MAWVNLPVVLIFLSGVVPLFAARAQFLLLLSRYPLLAPIWLPAEFVAAWLWWSINVTKWRLWALERADNWEELERQAIQDGLIWDGRSLCGRIFGRTEIWSRKDRERYAELRSRRAREAVRHYSMSR
jgi:hypothetical protein